MNLGSTYIDSVPLGPPQTELRMAKLGEMGRKMSEILRKGFSIVENWVKTCRFCCRHQLVRNKTKTMTFYKLFNATILWLVLLAAFKPKRIPFFSANEYHFLASDTELLQDNPFLEALAGNQFQAISLQEINFLQEFCRFCKTINFLSTKVFISDSP